MTASPEDDLEASAVEVARELFDVVGDVLLDMDLPWTTVRAVFAQSLFERARHRYGAMPRVAAALDTALRTVRRNVKAGASSPIPAADSYNTRWRALAALNEGPKTLEQIRRVVPRAADVDLAAQALESLLAAGRITHDERSGLYRRVDNADEGSANDGTRGTPSRTQRVRPRVDALSSLLRMDDEARKKARAIEQVKQLSPELEAEFVEDLRATMDAFETRWARRLDKETPDADS